jgi:hypothetical protein
MRFDANGNHIRSLHKTHQIHDDVVVEDLSSRFYGLSDKSLEIVRSMVNKDKIEKLDKLLIALNCVLN